MRYLVMVLFLFSIVSCKSQHNNLSSDQAVISPESKMDWVFGKNYKSYDPTDADIEAAEKIMRQGFEDQKKETRNNIGGKSPDDYNRQFVGAIDENGDKLIYVNCFCKKEIEYFKDWKDKIIHVADGGSCFFHATINLTKNKYTNFSINGDA